MNAVDAASAPALAPDPDSDSDSVPALAPAPGPLEMQMQMKCLHQVRGGAEIMPLFRFVQTPPDKSRTTEDYGMQCGLRPELL